MVLETKRHQESYERQSYRCQNIKQGRDNVFTAKIDRSFVELMYLEVKMQKSNKD